MQNGKKKYLSSYTTLPYNIGDVTARLAGQGDEVSLIHFNHGLRVAARVALDKLLDESFENFGQRARVVRTVHQRLPAVLTKLGLCSELTTEILGRVTRWPTESCFRVFSKYQGKK